MGGRCWALPLATVFHRGCVTTTDCESCLFQFCDIKRAQECVNRTDFTHWKWEGESTTERDLSSCQCLFISIQITLPSFQTSPLSSAFILFPYSDSSLFTAENKTFSFALTVVSLLSGHATLSLLISQGTACCPLLEERILAFEKNWHFKIKQGKTTHWNGNYIFLQVHQTKLYRSVPLNLSNCWSFILHCLQLAFCAVTDLL